MSLFDQIAAADDIMAEEYPIPEWGVTVILRSPTMQERNRLATAVQSANVANDGIPDLDVMYSGLIVACVYDPESNAPVFTPDTVGVLRERNGKVVERLAQACLRVAGMGEDAVPTQSGDSGLSLAASTSTTSQSD